MDEAAERAAWCRHHRTDVDAANFTAGQTMRCPHSRTFNNGRRRVCGEPLGNAPPGTRVVVRVYSGRPRWSECQERTCIGCHKLLEVFEWVSQRMERTG